jgi:hypothetical protein
MSISLKIESLWSPEISTRLHRVPYHVHGQCHDYGPDASDGAVALEPRPHAHDTLAHTVEPSCGGLAHCTRSSPGKGELAEVLRHGKHAGVSSQDEVQDTDDTGNTG